MSMLLHGDDGSYIYIYIYVHSSHGFFSSQYDPCP